MNEEFLSHKFSLRIKILWLHSTKNKKKLEMEGGEKLRNYFYNRKLFLFSAIKWKLIINIELIQLINWFLCQLAGN